MTEGKGSRVIKMTTSEKIIAFALAEVGYLEKATNAYLDDKTKNAGKANYTKYGRWYGINPGAWCAMFVSWCADKAGAGEIIPRHASCSLGIEAWRKLGRWHPGKGYTPQKGDIIYFGDKNGAPAHVGIVYDLDRNYVYTIEGNTSGGSGVISNGGGVAQKYYPRDYSRILGYGNPDWAALEAKDKKANTKEVINMTPGEFLASLTDAQAYEIYSKALKHLGAQNIPEGYNARAEYELAKEHGITDGSRPLAPASRLEVAIMVERGRS